VTQFTIRAPAGDSIDRRGGIAISRDGRRIMFAAVHGAESRWRLYLRDLGEPEANPIPGTEGAEAPFFSPDGKWLAYVDGNTARLMKLELPGGSPQAICDCGHVSGYASNEGAEWGEDGWIILGSWLGMQGLRRVNASGGRPEPMPVSPGTFEPDEYAIINPHRLPGGRVALVASSQGRVATIDLRTGERKRVIGEAGFRTTFLDPGYLVYGLGSELWAVRFDAAALKTRGDPVRVKDGIGWPYALSPAGTLVFPPATQGSGTSRLVRVDRNDLLEPIGGMSGGGWLYPRVASDGGRVVAVGGPEPGHSGLWVFDLNRHQLRRLGDRSRDHFVPLFTPDGKRIVFTSPSKSRNAWNLHWILSDGTGEAEQLTDTTLTQQAVSWLPDGTTLAFQRGVEPKTGWDMYLLPLAGDRAPKPLLVTPANERAPAFSPDGRWLAYVSDEGGRDQVYLRRYPELDAPVQVSNDGGDHPVWSRDGGEIFFVEGKRILVTSFRDGVFDKPRQVADGNERPRRDPLRLAMPYGRHYDVMPDGRHLVVVQAQDQQYRLGEFQVMLNLGTELWRLLPLE
jgi:Tol biopolymer transport system component